LELRGLLGQVQGGGKRGQWGLQQNKALQRRRDDFYTVKKERSKIKGKHQNLKEKEKKQASTANVRFP
jgi:hypothetical protein